MDTVLIETADRVTTVTINRPDVRNAVDRATAEQLSAAFTAFDADESADVAVLTGAGGTFCAGADLKAVADGTPNRTESNGDGPMGPTRMALSKPVIAAVSGHAVAGGLELAIWADLRVIDRSAVFGVFCRRWGVPLIDGGTVRLPRLIGQSRAMDLILTGRPVDADEAMAIGLANRLVDGDVVTAAQELARSLSALPQSCLRGDRRSALAQWGLPESAAMAGEFDLGMASLRAGAREGATRFRDGAGRGGSFG